MRELQFGVEIEFFGVNYNDAITALVDAGIKMESFHGYTHDDSKDTWKITTDSSVTSSGTGVAYGLELVSPILKGDAGLDELRIAVDTLSRIGAKIDKTCGLHVHHNAADLPMTALAKVVLMYYKYQKAFNSILPMSRRTAKRNWYCRPIPSVEVANLIEKQTNENIVKPGEMFRIMHLNRYTVVNVKAYYRHKTIEFRQHNGSLNSDKIEAWVLLTYQLVNHCSVIEKVDRPTRREGLKCLISELNLQNTWLERFYIERAEQLNNEEEI